MLEVPFKETPPAVTPVLATPGAAPEFERSIQHRIGERAYYLFESSGRMPGRDKENWAEAEAQVLKPGLQVRESGSWLVLSGSVSEASAESVHILMLPHRVIVATIEDEIFLFADLSVEIDPSTATASCKHGQLRLMVKKCGALHENSSSA